MPASQSRSENQELRVASEALAGHARVGLSSEDWMAFMPAADAMPRKHPRMERLLNEPNRLDD